MAIDPNPSGLCFCGCGQTTALITKNHQGQPKGTHWKYRHGHARRSAGIPYVEEDRGYVTPCWIWQLSKFNTGYGQAWDGERVRTAHSLYYEREYGPVPEGHELDHLCRQRPCCRPDHLEAIPIWIHRLRHRKATLEQRLEIVYGNESAYSLAKRLPIGDTQIRKIRRQGEYAVPIIEFTINPATGEMTSDFKGIVGPACDAIQEEIEKYVGGASHVEKKHEYFVTPKGTTRVRSTR